jgi:flagellar basal body-associated protein FliL
VIAGLIVLGGGAAAFFLLPRSTAAHRAPAPVPVATVTVPQITTNLADTDQVRLVQVAVTAEVRGEKAQGAWAKDLPAIEDATIAILHGRTASQLAGSDGLRQLAAALVEAYDRVLGGQGQVQRLYFTQFVVQ